MATVKPFAALRPDPKQAARVCELPYDVMSSDEARKVAAGNPLSFLRVSKPEIDLPPGTDPCAPEVYAKGMENFQKLIQDGALKQDSQACFYLYRQVMDKHSQVGLVATASCEEYMGGGIKKHELTRPDKVDDRARHIETLNAQTGPVFLTYRAQAELDKFIAKKISKKPDTDFTARDNVRHTGWVINDEEEIKFIETQFSTVPYLYIADGHHRCAAATRIFRTRNGAGQSGQFLAVIFPHNQMQILPYHRLVKDLNNWTPEQLLEIIGAVFPIEPDGKAQPAHKHEIGLYVAGKWYTLGVRVNLGAPRNSVDSLDVSALQDHIMSSVFGIDDPRTSQRLGFVGGIRGTAELERLVNSGEYACAFSMFPTSIEELIAIADAGGIMPPKSTWFEPKLRDAMFCHLI